ncbi:hypothetical protein, partial [Alloalcanivorax venustensis]|uniref:hypothetical protein n=1 Tax=Alloalcanivorax venustensis TaxID=172371 RepID=UPI001E51F606
MIALKILVIGFGAICLLSLAIYVWLARAGNSLTLYLTFDHRLLSVKQKVFDLPPIKWTRFVSRYHS